MNDELKSKAVRSRIMAAVKRQNTTPEMVLRSALHRAGYRFRIHTKSLPGTPDIVLPKYRTVIFVHGCFWHRHLGCRKTTTPKNNGEFWALKFEKNIERDERKTRELEDLGWHVLVVWECQINKTGDEALEIVNDFLRRLPCLVK